MNLQQHFDQHVHSNVDLGTEAIIDSILSDPEAMQEHEEGVELWYELDLKTLGEHLRSLSCLRDTEPAGSEINIARQHIQIGQRVEDLWLDSLKRRVAVMYEEVDLDALAEAEHEPFDSTHIESAPA